MIFAAVVSSPKGCLFVLKRLTQLVSLTIHVFVLQNLIVKGVISVYHDNMYFVQQSLYHNSIQLLDIGPG